jgi:hypothetical protein
MSAPTSLIVNPIQILERLSQRAELGNGNKCMYKEKLEEHGFDFPLSVLVTFSSHEFRYEANWNAYYK